MYRERTRSYIRKKKEEEEQLVYFFCVNNCSSRLNYFLSSSPFNSVYLTFSLSFGAGRAIIGNSASRNHEDSRQEVRLLFTEKQLRKRRYLRRLHSNLIIPRSSLPLSSRTPPLLASGPEISCILHSAQFRDVISSVSARL